MLHTGLHYGILITMYVIMTSKVNFQLYG